MPESTPPARQNRATRRAAKARLRRTEAQRTASLAPAATDRVAAIDQDLRQALGPAAVEHLPTGAIRPNPRNARRHSRKQIEQLADSLRAFGFLCPVIIDEAEQLLAGHGRLVAAKALGLATVPCLRVQHLTPEAKRAFALADNRLAELSDWDEDLLKVELEELAALEADLTFSLEVTGFDTVDLDRLLGPEPSPTGQETADGLSTDPDDVLPPLARQAVSRSGDLWQMGSHRALCGDALDRESYERLLQGERVTQVFTDPPYNVPVGKHVTASASFREFGMASGEMSEEAFTTFLATVLGHTREHLVDGAILHVCMDWRHQTELLAAARRVDLVQKNLCVWVKPVAGMGSFYRSQHELVFVLKAGAAPHINTFGLGGRGRSRSNTWRYPSVQGPRRGVNSPDGGHPTVKPISLVIDALRDCSHRGDLILDPFGGSGTTLIAAARTRRRARLIELDPLYVDLIVRRWQAVTGGSATLGGDGRTFDEIAAARQSDGSQSDGAPIEALAAPGGAA